MENENAPAPKPRAPRVRKPVVTIDAEPIIETLADEAGGKKPFLSGEISLKTALGIAVVAGLIGGGAGVVLTGLTGTSFRSVVQPQTVNITSTSSTSSATAVAAKALQSVVTIEATGSNGAGSGSGVIYSADGYIITNNHVATVGGTGQTTIRVTLSDGRLFPATIVGTDPILDVAVIKIDADGLVPVTFAAADSITVGSEVIAIGAPLGLQNTVTDGVVSALNRSITISNSQNGFNFDLPGADQSALAQDLSLPVIQTDASINPGNSGGALLNAVGELVGINVAIASSGSSSGSIGVGFALPATLVQRVAIDLIENGTAQHGRIGAMVSGVSASTGVIGAEIQGVDAGSPAAAAGLRKGDIVTTFNGIPIRDEVDITAQVRSLRPGEVATFTYVRGGVSYDGSVTVGSLE